MADEIKADLAVLGAGPGGYVAALRAAQKQLKVVVVERDEVGGTCLNRGCIPTKALLASIEVMELSGQARAFGLIGEQLKPDLAAMLGRKDRIVRQLVNGVKFLFKNRNIELIKGTGRLVSQTAIEVKLPDNRTVVVKSAKIIVATGSEPAQVPGFNYDGKFIINSTDALKMSRVPESILIVGAGAIGCEFATVFNRLGSKVTIVELLPQILPAEDEEISNELRKNFESRGIQIFTGVKVEKTGVFNGLVRAELSNNKALEVQQLLVAVGRSLNTEGIGLDNLKVGMNKKAVAVNERMETNVQGIYAVGDITGKILLAHAASHQGLVAVANILGENKAADYKAVPGCIYTRPEVASVGLSEGKARAAGYNIAVGKFPFSANGKAICLNETKGMVKIIMESGTRKLLGVHIIGPQATNIIAEAAMALKLGCTAEQLAETIHAHPTLSEAIMEAAESALGSPLHI